MCCDCYIASKKKTELSSPPSFRIQGGCPNLVTKKKVSPRGQPRFFQRVPKALLGDKSVPSGRALGAPWESPGWVNKILLFMVTK